MVSYSGWPWKKTMRMPSWLVARCTPTASLSTSTRRPAASNWARDTSFQRECGTSKRVLTSATRGWRLSSTRCENTPQRLLGCFTRGCR